MEKNNLKIFFIKLAAITLSIIIIINVVFNLLLAERIEKIDSLLSLDKRFEGGGYIEESQGCFARGG